MSNRPTDAVDPRQHAVRTLAALLVRHGAPKPVTPEPAPTMAALSPANDVALVRQAA